MSEVLGGIPGGPIERETFSSCAAFWARWKSSFPFGAWKKPREFLKKNVRSSVDMTSENKGSEQKINIDFWNTRAAAENPGAVQFPRQRHNKVKCDSLLRKGLEHDRRRNEIWSRSVSTPTPGRVHPRAISVAEHLLYWRSVSLRLFRTFFNGLKSCKIRSTAYREKPPLLNSDRESYIVARSWTTAKVKAHNMYKHGLARIPGANLSDLLLLSSRNFFSLIDNSSWLKITFYENLIARWSFVRRVRGISIHRDLFTSPTVYVKKFVFCAAWQYRNVFRFTKVRDQCCGNNRSTTARRSVIFPRIILKQIKSVLGIILLIH